MWFVSKPALGLWLWLYALSSSLQCRGHSELLHIAEDADNWKGCKVSTPRFLQNALFHISSSLLICSLVYDRPPQRHTLCCRLLPSLCVHGMFDVLLCAGFLHGYYPWFPFQQAAVWPHARSATIASLTPLRPCFSKQNSNRCFSRQDSKRYWHASE